VIVGGPTTNPWLGPLGHIIGMSPASLPASQKTTFFISKVDSDDLATLADLIESGKVTPVIERIYPLSRVAEAMGYLGSGHAKGKLVITV
jgi:NADPH:quinone reductase-like Zn-dependent oxidoreductase